MSIKIGGLILILFLLVIFSFQNTQPISIKFLAWETSLPSALLMLITFLLGLAMGWTIGTFKKTFRKP